MASKYILITPVNEQDMKLVFARLTEQRFFPRVATAEFAAVNDTLPLVDTPGYDYRQFFIVDGYFDGGILLHMRDQISPIAFNDYIDPLRWVNHWQMSSAPVITNVEATDPRILRSKSIINQTFIVYSYINLETNQL